ncbi:hypothetical protein [Candidatus Litorirhabdus singularis]|nr:hypothetical protein [Candidatus Litorirhabdus singularis]
MSDLLSGPFSEGSLRYAILIASGAYLWAAVHFHLAGGTVVDDLRAAQS